MIGRSIDDIGVGEQAEISRQVSDEDIARFVEAVGDYNPVHSDRQYAAETSFGEPIAPGVWTAGLISAVIGTRLPGPGAIYLSQSLKFLRPVLFGDTITARVEVLEVNREKNRMRLLTTCANQHGELVLTGEAIVMPPKSRVVYAPARDGAGWLAMWALAPWAWVTHAATVWTMMALSAVALTDGAPEGRARS